MRVVLDFEADRGSLGAEDINGRGRMMGQNNLRAVVLTKLHPMVGAPRRMFMVRLAVCCHEFLQLAGVAAFVGIITRHRQVKAVYASAAKLWGVQVDTQRHPRRHISHDVCLARGNVVPARSGREEAGFARIEPAASQGSQHVQPCNTDSVLAIVAYGEGHSLLSVLSGQNPCEYVLHAHAVLVRVGQGPYNNHRHNHHHMHLHCRSRKVARIVTAIHLRCGRQNVARIEVEVAEPEERRPAGQTVQLLLLLVASVRAKDLQLPRVLRQVGNRRVGKQRDPDCQLSGAAQTLTVQYARRPRQKQEQKQEVAKTDRVDALPKSSLAGRVDGEDDEVRRQNGRVYAGRPHPVVEMLAERQKRARLQQRPRIALLASGTR